MEIQLSSSTNIQGMTFSSPEIMDQYQIHKDRDVFEDVIDSLMLENYNNDLDVKEYIKSLPNENKRIAILSLIGDDNLLWSKVRDIIKSNKPSYEYLKEIIYLLREYVKIADVERKKHGEVLTPFDQIAKPMVQLVEKYDPEFWKNPNHKVLDSSAGYGTFLILAAYKFMNGLKDWEPDPEKRFKWIVENCLYYGELQARSVFSWLVTIDPHNKYKTNTYWGDFLSKEFEEYAKEVWGVEKWDLIIQNPPYQMRKEGFKKTQPLWHLFVQKCLTLLEKDGYMVMVHPSGWRNIDGIFKDIQIKLKSNQILEIHIHDESEGVKLFGATTGFDYYILKNIPCSKMTKIIGSEEGLIDLNKFEFIPSGSFDIFNKLIKKEFDRVRVLYSRSSYGTDKKHMSRVKDREFIYPCSYTVQKNSFMNLFYSNTNSNGHFGIPKVIWSNGKASNPLVDINGEFGLTQFSYAILDDKQNLESIKKAMNTDKFINMMKSCDMNDGNRFNRKVLSQFKKDFWKEFI